MCILHSKKQIIVQTPFFVYPVTENEVERITQIIKDNSSLGLDEIPKYLVEQCTLY